MEVRQDWYTDFRAIEKRRGIVGDGLLSHRVAPALPSTLVALTAGFGMEPGVPPPLLPPTIPLLLFTW